MKGLFKKVSAAAAAAVLSVSTLAVSASAFGGVTTSDTPVSAEKTGLKWVYQAAELNDWMNAPGMPSVIGNDIVYVKGMELCAVDKETGKPLAKKGTLASSASYGLSAPVYADGKIFVALFGGIVQAFDAETFETLWVYHDALGGQANSSITYDNGYIYTGFWNDNVSDANYVCLPIEDKDPSSSTEEQAPAWTYKAKGGYYWTGAYVTKDMVLFGTENGEDSADGKGSKIVAIDKNASISAGNAVVSSEVSDIEGDLRSGVAYDSVSGYYYITSKANKLIRFKTDAEGVISDVQALELPGVSTSTPVIANGRLYLGIGSNSWNDYSGQCIAVIDTQSFTIAYTVETNGQCQSSALICDKGGENYVYFTANAYPGNIYILHDHPGMTAPEKTVPVELSDRTALTCPVLFAPAGDYANYCLSSVLSDDNGTLYFKNDSNAIYALEALPSELIVSGSQNIYKEGDTFSAAGLTVTAVYANGTEKDVTDKATVTNAPEGPLAAGSFKITVDCALSLAPDGKSTASMTAEDTCYVLAAADYDSYQDTVNAIEKLTNVTAASKNDITKARKLYNSLSDTAKALVYNYDLLTDAEDKITELMNKEPGTVTFKDSFSCTDTAVRISWNTADNAYCYRLYYYKPSKGKYVKLGDLKGTSARVRGLFPGSEYKFAVKAIAKNSDGTFTFGKLSAAKTAVTRPSHTKITKVNVSKKAVRLFFNRAVGADGYKLQMYNETCGWRTLKVISAKNTNIRIEGLHSKTSYRFRLVPISRTSLGTVLGYPTASKTAKTK